MKKIDGIVNYKKTVICPVCNTPKTRIIPNDEAEIRCPEQCLTCGIIIVCDPDCEETDETD